jgi:putative transposase
VVVDCPLHVVQRGINGSVCFFADGDYRSYLEYVGEFSARFSCAIHAYCLMTNHVHLLLTPHSRDGCALFMKNLGQNYVQRVNHRLNRTGTLWEGNPVRAGMVATPSDYPWSSYRANAGGHRHRFLQAHPTYASLGPVAYKTICEEDVPAPTLDEIRKATRVGSAMGVLRRGKGRPRAEK